MARQLNHELAALIGTAVNNPRKFPRKLQGIDGKKGGRPEDLHAYLSALANRGK